MMRLRLRASKAVYEPGAAISRRSRSLSILPSLVLSISVTTACARSSAPSKVPSGANTNQQAAPHTDRTATTALDRIVVTPRSVRSIGEIFADAEQLFAQHRMQPAALGFDRVVTLDPDGAYAAPSLYDAGLAYEEIGDHQAAAQRFAEIPRRFVDHALAQQSLVRAIRLEMFLEHWQVAGRYALTLFERYKEQNPFEAIVGYGARAFMLLEAGRLDEASYAIEKGRELIDSGRLDSAGRIPRDLAQLYYALGELRRLRGESIHLDPDPQRFAQVLEQRCQLLLDAQGAYSDVMRAYDAHWSAMAGFRVGELYQRLHEELMAIPTPKSATDEHRRQLFDGAMRVRYEVLLRKGLAMMEHTIAMAERAQRDEAATGAEDRDQDLSTWVARAREAQARMEQAMTQEQESIRRLPYSREELMRALDELETRSKSANRPRN